MEDGLLLILGIIGSIFAITAFFVVVGALFQNLVQRTKQACDTLPGRSLAVGLVNVIFIAIVALGFNALGDATGLEIIKLPALLLIIIVAILIAYGLTGMAWLIGARLSPDRGWAVQLFLGSLTMVLACLTPYIGWLMLTPYLCFRGLGGTLLGLSRSRSMDPEVLGGNDVAR